jgi:OFA family oxalate/formate antiporter-like MFS transporter
MQNPSEGWKPQGWVPSATQAAQRSSRDYTLGQALGTWQWWVICLLMSVNTMSGLSIISQASPILQEMGKASAETAAFLVGIIAIFNGVGRIFWSWFSDLTSRRIAFFVMYLVEVAIFWTYQSIGSLALLTIATFVVAMCYGGAYGITPAFAADYFGPRDVGSIFGLMMLPWAFAAAAGPYVFAYLRQANGNYVEALHAIAGTMTFALILPVLVRPPKGGNRAENFQTDSRFAVEAVPGDSSEG